MARTACKAYGYELSDKIEEEFKYRTTHNDGVFSRLHRRKSRPPATWGIITGLPDAYGRGRIIGDYRRVALYGMDRLIRAEEGDKTRPGHCEVMDADTIRQLEELYEQIQALEDMKEMAADVRLRHLPARPSNAREAVQWLYFGYLARHQGAERRGHEPGPRLHLPGHLL